MSNQIIKFMMNDTQEMIEKLKIESKNRDQEKLTFEQYESLMDYGKQED